MKGWDDEERELPFMWENSWMSGSFRTINIDSRVP